jgi:NAD+--asparagine ADP-ribosyltransferase
MLFARNISKRFFGKKNLFVWGKSKYLNDKPTDITDKIDGKIKKVGIGSNHMGIVTECGKLYMMGKIFSAISELIKYF